MNTVSLTAAGRQFRLHPSVTLSVGDGYVDLLHPAFGGYRLRGLNADTLAALRALADSAGPGLRPEPPWPGCWSGCRICWSWWPAVRRASRC